MENKITIWAVYADAFIDEILRHVEVAIPGSSKDALDAGKEEFFELFGQYPTYACAYFVTSAYINGDTYAQSL
jgi:hypothetical protein